MAKPWLEESPHVEKDEPGREWAEVEVHESLEAPDVGQRDAERQSGGPVQRRVQQETAQHAEGDPRIDREEGSKDGREE